MPWPKISLKYTIMQLMLSIISKKRTSSKQNINFMSIAMLIYNSMPYRTESKSRRSFIITSSNTKNINIEENDDDDEKNEADTKEL